MVLNNLFGFTGHRGLRALPRDAADSSLWVLYLVIKVSSTDAGIARRRTRRPAGGRRSGRCVSVVIGFCDVGQRARHLPLRQAALLVVARRVSRSALLFGFLLFTLGGWMMARSRHTTDFGRSCGSRPSTRSSAPFWLAWILGDAQPVRDQRRQLLRVDQRRPEPARRLVPVAPPLHLPHRRRRSGRSPAGGELPRH